MPLEPKNSITALALHEGLYGQAQAEEEKWLLK